MIRHDYICNKVLQIYKNFNTISFPISLELILPHMPNCRSLTYQELAEINGCSASDVITFCESNDGCTHYDISNNRYLILWNDDSSNNKGRKRWTQAHEVGHIILEHFSFVAAKKLAENGFNNLNTSMFEAEADAFAATYLCPMPLFELLEIESPIDIKDTFGLSMKASVIRWSAYGKWRHSRRKSAWENDMKKLYLERKP